ncbi:MAG TPA: SAM-dependent methyltransferase [Saprospiraceae bacterium]|nr:SAM-dependent methyltransferase [Saprospiraceae bacterium]HQW56590.1 SAM-dependent methyltransferase [Saprospiraceae bacterium]
MKNSPEVHLIPVPISEESLFTLPVDTIEVARQLTTFLVEREKTARKWLKSFQHPIAQSDLHIIELPKHEEITKEWLMESLQDKASFGLMSESGTPCIADPGSIIVRQLHQLGWKIKPHSGPNSLILALMASGLNGQNFTFLGYLPQKQPELQSILRKIVSDIQKTGISHLFIETPYRNFKLFQTLLSTLPPDIYLSISRDLTGTEEWIRTQSIKSWKKGDYEHILNKWPTIFILGL